MVTDVMEVWKNYQYSNIKDRKKIKAEIRRDIEKWQQIGTKIQSKKKNEMINRADQS